MSLCFGSWTLPPVRPRVMGVGHHFIIFKIGVDRYVLYMTILNYWFLTKRQDCRQYWQTTSWASSCSRWNNAQLFLLHFYVSHWCRILSTNHKCWVCQTVYDILKVRQQSSQCWFQKCKQSSWESKGTPDTSKAHLKRQGTGPPPPVFVHDDQSIWFILTFFILTSAHEQDMNIWL